MKNDFDHADSLRRCEFLDFETHPNPNLGRWQIVRVAMVGENNFAGRESGKGKEAPYFSSSHIPSRCDHRKIFGKFV